MHSVHLEQFFFTLQFEAEVFLYGSGITHFSLCVIPAGQYQYTGLKMILPKLS